MRTAVLDSVRLPGRLLAVLPWLLLAALTLVGVAIGQGGWRPTLAYQTYALGAVAIPGFLVARVLGGARSVPEDLGVGFALGAAGQLVLWALHQWLGGPAWLMWTGPVGVVVAVLAVPALRRRNAGGQAAPVWFHWVLAGLTGVGLWSLWPGQLMTPPLTRNFNEYQDLWYHLALGHEMLRAFRLVSPDAVGAPLTYHWFSNAYMAAGHLMSGVDLYSVLVRQWLVPMFVGCMLGTVALARRMTDSWHAAWIAPALAFALPGAFVPYGDPASPVYLGFLPASPSTILGLVMVLAAATLALTLWQERAPRTETIGRWVLLVVVVLASGGAKPTVLPILGFLAGGWVLASLVGPDGPRRRAADATGPHLVQRVPWSGLAVGLLAVVVTLLGSGFVSDDVQSSSGLQLGGFLRFMPGFPEMSGMSWQMLVSQQGVSPALTRGTAALRAVAITMGWLALVQASHWLPLFALPARRLRAHRGAWTLLAAVVGSWAVFAVVDHPGGSEMYFPRTVLPLAAVLVAWVLNEGARASGPAATAVLAAAGAGILAVAVGWQDASPRVGEGSHLADVATVFAAVVAVALVLWAVQRAVVRDADRRAPIVVLVIAAVVAGTLVAPLRGTVLNVAQVARTGVPAAPAADPDDRLYVSAEELEAAAWLGANARPDDVVASATLCTPATGIAPNCRGDQFWIPGISGLRMLLAGWYYLPTGAPALAGDGDVDSRIALSQKLVADPDRSAVDTAVDRYGVRWVVADRRTGPVSDRLADHGTVRFDNGVVQIVELDR